MGLFILIMLTLGLGAAAVAWFILSLTAVKRAVRSMPLRAELLRMADDEFRYEWPLEVSAQRCKHFAYLIHEAL